MRYIFFIFSFIGFSVKKIFSVKKFFIIKLFFRRKTFFSVNNVYFVKTANIFFIIFFQLSFATTTVETKEVLYKFLFKLPCDNCILV